MKKLIVTQAIFLTFFLVASPVLAQSDDVAKIQTFIQSVIQVLVTLSGLVAAGFFVWGGFRYITSSGDPESLDKSKKPFGTLLLGWLLSWEHLYFQT